MQRKKVRTVVRIAGAASWFTDDEFLLGNAASNDLEELQATHESTTSVGRVLNTYSSVGPSARRGDEKVVARCVLVHAL